MEANERKLRNEEKGVLHGQFYTVSYTRSVLHDQKQQLI